MKLYVEEQDMPQNCAECKAEGHYENSYGDEYGFFCPFGYKEYTEKTRDAKRLDNCPLVPIPPHGRLVDADSETFPTPHRNPSNDYMKGWNACLRSVQQQPTIIPASEDGE